MKKHKKLRPKALSPNTQVAISMTTTNHIRRIRTRKGKKALQQKRHRLQKKKLRSGVMTMDSVPSTIKDIPIDDDNGSIRPKMLAVDDLRSSD